MSQHKCRHCGDDIVSRRLWLPRPAGEPFWLPPPFEVAYESLDDGGRFCRGVDLSEFGVTVQLPEVFQQLEHQPMPRIGV